MKRLIIILGILALFVLPSQIFAKAAIVGFTALTGGGTGALDAIECEDIKGDDSDRAIATGDIAVGAIEGAGGATYIYTYDSTGTDSESSPTIIVPDDQASDCSSAGQWNLAHVVTGAMEVVTTTDGSESPTAAQMYGTMFIADNATAANDTDYTLPSAAAGMSACFYDNGDGTGGIIVDAATGDEILLEGSGVGTADAIDSPGVAGDGANGDFICIFAISADYWITLGSSGTWVDGGAD